MRDTALDSMIRGASGEREGRAALAPGRSTGILRCLQKARKRRNDLAHGGHVDRDGAFECVNAMRAMLGTVVSGDIPRPASSEFVMSEITTP